MRAAVPEKKDGGMERMEVWMKVHINRDDTKVVKFDTQGPSRIYHGLKCLDG